MNHRSWLILSCMALALMTLIAYWDEWQTEQEVYEKASKNRIDFPNKAQIKHLTFYHRDDKLRLNAERFTKVVPNSKSWEISAPLRTFADDRVIDTFLDHMEKYQYEKELDKDFSEFNVFGIDLKCPDVEIAYEKPNGELARWRIFVGQDAPVGYMVYFTLNSMRKVYIGSKHLSLMLKKSPFDLREKRLLRPWLRGIEELVIEKDTKEVLHLRKPPNGNDLVMPSGQLVALEKMEKAREELEKISVTEFLLSESFQEIKDQMVHTQPKLSFIIKNTFSMETTFHIYPNGGEFVALNLVKGEAFKLPLGLVRYVDNSLAYLK